MTPNPSASSLASALASVPMFRRLRPEDRAAVEAISELRRHARGAALFREGDPAPFLHIVIEGSVKVVKATAAGRDVILEVFGAGEPFGAVAALEELPYPASAIALEETLTLVIRREELFVLLEGRPTLIRGLLSGLTLRLVELSQRLADQSGGRVEARLARVFSRFVSERGERQGGEIFVAVPLSRQELADLAGTTIETAIRTMSRWEREGLILTERGGFRIGDPAALDELAQS